MTTQTQTPTIHQLMQQCESREQKKQLLKSLSVQAKEQIELGTTEEATVNSVLMSWLVNDEHTEFNNFWEWKKKGFKVKKGAQAFFVWSRKRKATEKSESQDQDDKEYSFFSLAYLFSNAQVEPISTKDDD